MNSAVNYMQWQIKDFPDGRGALTPVFGQNLIFGKIFARNCMKMKEFGQRGGARP